MPVDGKALGTATDALNVLLAAAEDRLCEMALGVEAHVTMNYGVLSFRKEGNVWGLFVVDQNGGIVRLGNAPRYQRIEAAQWLSKLSQQLHMNAATLAEDLRVATEAARGFLYPERSGPQVSEERGSK